MPSSEATSGLTVLQVLPWLNYGGVETYAIRLARGLRDRGHRVVVVSGGGRLVPELEASGIEHVRIDFTGLRLLSGLARLRRLMEREHVDLVNAHNWRAGLAAFFACRLAGVPFVLTVHGTRRPLHRHAVFYWSERMVVVSEASRRNLVTDFGLPSERVVKSVIGVDCDRFSPGPPDGQLEQELGLRPGAPRVVHVSRFSHSKAPVALALIQATPELAAQVPGIELVIVGQGPEEGVVARAAEEMNSRLDRKAVYALGGRSDIPQIMRLATVVVGTASVALEAMSSGKPVVAVGKGGYLGIVRPETLEEAEDSCFGDHEKVQPIRSERVARDLVDLFSNPEEAAELGRFGRAAAQSRHGAVRLAQDIEDIYLRVLCDRNRVRRILVFHLNQIGDLIFTLPPLKALREAFPKAHITSVVRPHLSGLLAHSGFVDDIIERPPGGPWPAMGLGIRQRRARPDLTIGFSHSATMTLCAWLSGSPHRTGYADSNLSRLLSHRVQVRGILSPKKANRLVQALGLGLDKRDYVGLVRLSAEDREYGSKLVAESGLKGAGPLIALAPGESTTRPYKSWSKEGFIEVARALVAEHDAEILVVGGPDDRPLGDEIAESLGQHAANLAGNTTPGQLGALLEHCRLLIGIDSGPMHVAAAMSCPVVGLFGPTDPWRTGPEGEGHEVVFHEQPCWPCIHPVTPTCGDRPCMSSITVGEVLAAASRILARGKKGRDALTGPRGRLQVRG